MLDKVLTGSAGELLEKVGGLVDEVVTTKEEKIQSKLEIKRLIEESQAQAAAAVSNRWEYDMKSDNKLSKNIRPLALIFLTVVFVFISAFDGNVGSFELDDAYKTIYQSLLMAVYGAYFVGRTVEKANSARQVSDEITFEELDPKPKRRRRRRSKPTK